MGHHICLILLPLFIITHGSVHQRIVELSAAISQYPDSTQLYMERGELYLQHETFDSARADFHVCIGKGLWNSRVLLGLSKSIFPFGLSDSALYYVDLALEQDDLSPSALEWKGFVLQRMDRPCAAAETYERLIALEPHSSPALFMDASRAWVSCDEADTEQKAIQILRVGISRMGKIHVLEKELVRVYKHYKRYDEALKVQTDIIQQWAIKAGPYYDRAEIYLLTGDHKAAREDLNHALSDLDSLPAYKSNTPAMKEMRTKILSMLQQPGH